MPVVQVEAAHPSTPAVGLAVATARPGWSLPKLLVHLAHVRRGARRAMAPVLGSAQSLT